MDLRFKAMVPALLSLQPLPFRIALSFKEMLAKHVIQVSLSEMVDAVRFQDSVADQIHRMEPASDALPDTLLLMEHAST
jgi:hypothetical protein